MPFGIISWLKHYFSLQYVSMEFTDSVSGLAVCKYVDCFGNHVLKDNRWSLFEVQCERSS